MGLNFTSANIMKGSRCDAGMMSDLPFMSSIPVLVWARMGHSTRGVRDPGQAGKQARCDVSYSVWDENYASIPFPMHSHAQFGVTHFKGPTEHE